MNSASSKRVFGTIAVVLVTISGLRMVLDRHYETVPVKPDASNLGPSEHWAFVPPHRAASMESTRGKGISNPIDNFIVAQLEVKGLSLSPRADKITLLRRVTFDLTGLPPTIQEQDDFLADQAPDAYEKVVDRLLQSERFGERWAQYWLDLVRYAETDGSKNDRFRANAYKYRDYVIKAFNEDLPYDRFVQQQLAGDELEPDNPQALTATGFYSLGADDPTSADLAKRSTEFLNEVTDLVSKVFPGMTIGCARCHSHKFDPLSQKDYYRFRAFFAGIVRREEMPAVSRTQQQEYEKKLSAWRSVTAKVQSEIRSLIDPELARIRDEVVNRYPPDIQKILERPVARRSPSEQQLALLAERQITLAQREVIGRLTPEVRRKYEEIQAALVAHESRLPESLPIVMAVSDVGPEAPATVFPGGDTEKEPSTVEPLFPAPIRGSAIPNTKVEPDVSSSGRRAALARWLTHREHPLTARVIVNRLWQHHFGVGLVASPSDFGKGGEPPTHPELLDWLAVELMEGGWRLKGLHRLMVTSATYCQASYGDAVKSLQKRASAIDPENRLLWHVRPRRLDAEALRDSMLAISGELSLRPFGPSAPPEMFKNQYLSADIGEGTEGHKLRRSVYMLLRRNRVDPLSQAFDAPDRCVTCPSRNNTTTAWQALALLNGRFAIDRGRTWATNLVDRFGDDWQTLVRHAYHAAWGRLPTSVEVALALEFLENHARSSDIAPETQSVERFRSGGSRRGDSRRMAAVVEFCHVLLNSNEFLYVD